MTTKPHDFKVKMIDTTAADEARGCLHCGQDVLWCVRYRCPVCHRNHEALCCSSLGPVEQGMCTEGIIDAGTDHVAEIRADLIRHIHDCFDENMAENAGCTVEQIRADRIEDIIGPVMGHA